MTWLNLGATSSLRVFLISGYVTAGTGDVERGKQGSDQELVSELGTGTCGRGMGIAQSRPAPDVRRVAFIEEKTSELGSAVGFMAP